jgi:hypothetical protein
MKPRMKVEREPAMNNHQRYIPNPKLPVEAAVVACVFAILLYSFESAVQRCRHFDTVAGVALEILSRLFLLAWQLVPSYLFESSRVVGHLLHVATSFWPLFYALLS